jgi:hypothetical protein
MKLSLSGEEKLELKKRVVTIKNPGNRLSYKKPFLAPLDVQKAGSIADVIPSFKVIQSDSMSLNIGFDTEFQDHRDGSGRNRRVLSLQMSIAVGEILIRYFFLVNGHRIL